MSRPATVSHLDEARERIRDGLRMSGSRLREVTIEDFAQEIVAEGGLSSRDFFRRLDEHVKADCEQPGFP